MESSTSSAAKGFANAIVALTTGEIGIVAGGKAAQSVWDRLIAWIDGTLSSPPSGDGPFTITREQFEELEQIFYGAGNGFSATPGMAGAGFNVRLVGSDGEV